MTPTNNPQTPGVLDQLKNFLMGNAVLQHLAGQGQPIAPAAPTAPVTAPVQGPQDYIKNAVDQYMAANHPAGIPPARAVPVTKNPTVIALASPNTAKGKGKK